MIRILRSALLAAAVATVAPAGAAMAETLVVVANRVIYPGEVVTGDSIDEVPLRRTLRNPASVIYEPAQVTGKVARRTLLPGRMIPVNSVREPYLVEAGAPVRVVFEQGALVISTTGVPLQPGAAGDTIRLRNADSGIVFSGIVLEDGTVKVAGL